MSGPFKENWVKQRHRGSGHLDQHCWLSSRSESELFVRLCAGIPRGKPATISPPTHCSYVPYLINVSISNQRRRHLGPYARHCYRSNLCYPPFSTYNDIEVMGGLWNCQSDVIKADSISANTSLMTLHFLALTETRITPEETATPAGPSTPKFLLHTQPIRARGRDWTPNLAKVILPR